jgi:GTP-binding protein HflX
LSVFNREDDDGLSRGARALVALPERAGDSQRSAESRLDEAAGLAAAIGVEVVEKLAFRLRDPKPATLFGSGQVEQIALAARQAEAHLIIVDGALSPIQQRNLEKAIDAKVIDRTGLILEIFGERAATAEGRLQVELAHLDYQAGRLVRSWTHLERQRGGFGFLGGPGETQIEADRRLIRDRMAKLRRELEQVRRTRGLHRARRQRAPWPVIALVGYTNAGKSTLFNRITGATVMAEDLLFATLDPTMRQISLPGIDKAILSDTVGFVSDLPTQLVAAFRATLEEVTGADLIVHVRDIAHPDSDAQAADVLGVLGEIGVGPKAPESKESGEAGAPILEVWNKIDLLDPETRAATEAEAARREDVVTLSALSGEGMDGFRRIVSDRLSGGKRVRTLTLALADGAGAAWLHQHGEVLGQEVNGDRLVVEVRLADEDLARFESR